MVSFVLDSSIALSWFMPDEVAALALLDKTVQQGAIVPTIWLLEIGNVLLCAERANKLTIAQRYQALDALKDLPIKIDQTTLHSTWSKAMELAEHYKLTLYDASYLELALRCNLPLATLDKALNHAAQKIGIIIL